MGLFDFFNRKRAIPTTQIAILNPGSPVGMQRDYKSFATEGFQKNVIAYRCIERNADSVASLPIVLKKKTMGAADEEIHEHQVLKLLQHPNPMQSYSAFVKNFVGFLHISGNDYIHAVGPNPKLPPLELWHLRPDCVSILPGQFNLPKAYVFKKKGTEKVFQVDIVDGSCSIRHLKTFHPFDEWYGMAPIEAAAFSLDQHNAVGQWNLGLLQNSARPSGALVVKSDNSNPGGALTEEQRSFLRKDIQEQYAGAGQAGKFLILEGGMDWKEMGFSPADMNWIEGKNTSSRDIALALGNPPQMLGIPGDNTYSNYEQARLAYYLDTVIPLGKFWLEHLNAWLVPAFGEEGLCLEIDENKIEALEPMREKKWTQVQNANYLTINEKRERLGYGKYDEDAVENAADMLFAPPGLQPLDQVGLPKDENGNPIQEESDGEEDGNEPDTEDYSGNNENDEQGAGDDDEAAEDNGDSPKSAYIDGKKYEIKSRRGKEQYRQRIIAKRKRLSKRLHSSIKRLWKMERDKIIGALRVTHSWQEVESDVKNVLRGTEPKFEREMKSQIRIIIEAFGKDVLSLRKDFGLSEIEIKSADTKFNQWLDFYINHYLGNKITGIFGTTQKRVLNRLRPVFLEAMQEGDPGNALVKEVQKIYGDMTVNRAAVIVNTEVGMAQNEAQREAAKAMDVKGMRKTWLSEQVERTRQFPRDSTNHWDMSEVTVGLDEKFEVESDDGVDEMDGPGDRSAPADQVINCHCVLVFGMGE